MKIKNRDIRDWVALFVLRRARGNALMQIPMDIVQTGAYLSMIMIASERFFNMIIPTWIMFFASFMPALQYMMGWADEKKGFWKTEASYSAKQLNPFWAKMSENIEEIKKTVKNQ